MTLLLLAFPAWADPVVFDRFEFVQDSDGVLSMWAEAKASTLPERSCPEEGSARVSLEFHQGDPLVVCFDATTLSIERTIGPGEWGSLVEISPVDIEGADTVAIPTGAGARLPVQIRSAFTERTVVVPAPAVRPPAPAPRVEPLEAAGRRRLAERRARRRALEREQAEYRATVQARQAELESIADDPSHPLTQACTESLPRTLASQCVATSALRADGPAEVRACGALERVDLRSPCVSSLGMADPPWSMVATIEKCAQMFPSAPVACVQALAPLVESPDERLLAACAAIPDDPASCLALADRPYGVEESEECTRFGLSGQIRACVGLVKESTYQPHPLIAACIDGFGNGGAAIRCFKNTFSATTPPMQDIVDCAGLADERHKIACISRFRDRDWSPAELVAACSEHFPEEPLMCLAKMATESEPDVAIVASCREVFGTLERSEECLGMARNRSGDMAGTIAVCGAMFEEVKDRRTCLELSRRDPDPVRIEACSAEPKKGKRWECIGG